MTRILKPVSAGAAGVLLSLAVGLVVSWREFNRFATRAVIPAAPAPLPAAVKAKGWDFWTVQMENLSSELKEERERLKERSDALDQREARIAAIEKELGRTRGDIEALRKQISERVIEMSDDETVNLRKLSQTYSNLSPRAVVAIIREMDDATAVKILALMKPDVMGPIFEEMTKTAGPDGPLARRAATLSEKIRLMKASKPATQL